MTEITFVRDATLLDCLGVLADMGTPRGEEELAQARNIIGGSPSAERLAVLHYTGSIAVVAHAAYDLPGRALAVAGFQQCRPGVLRTWMFATDEAWEYGAELTKHVADGLEVALETAHRLEAICSDSRPQVHRWYSRIGLQKETTLRRYMADGSDAALFVRVRSNN